MDLTFEDFDVEAQSSCNYDALTIYDGTSSSDPILGKFCNGVPLPDKLRSTSGSLYLQFNSDSITELKGFNLTAREIELPGNFNSN